MSYNEGVNVSNWSSNAIKLGILLIVLAVFIGGIIVVLPILENVPLDEGQGDGAHYVFYEGEIFEDFEHITDWRVDGIGASQEADTSNAMQGNQSLKLTGTGGNVAFTTKTVNIDLSDATNVIVWVYVHNITSLNSVDFYLSPTTDWSAFFVLEIQFHTLVEGWNHIVITKPQFVVVGGAAWDGPIIFLRVRVQPKAGMDTSISFDDYRHSYQARPKAIIAFDDGWSNILNAKPIMDKNEQVGTVLVIAAAGTGFTIPGYNISGDYLTISQLQMLYEDEWDIGNHGYSHHNLSLLSPKDIAYEVNMSYYWLVANGFDRSAHIFAYPYGSYNDNIIEVVREQHSLGRTIVSDTYQPQLSNFDHDIQYKLKAFIVINTTPVQAIKDRIDSAILQNGLVILTFHQIVDEDAIYETQYLTSQFEEVSDYLKSREADIDVITLSSLSE